MDSESDDELTRVIVDVGTPNATVVDPTAEQLRELADSIAECLLALDDEPPWEPECSAYLDDPASRSR